MKDIKKHEIIELRDKYYEASDHNYDLSSVSSDAVTRALYIEYSNIYSKIAKDLQKILDETR